MARGSHTHGHLSSLQGKALEIEIAGTKGDVAGLSAVGAVPGPGGFGTKGIGTGTGGTGTGLALAWAMALFISKCVLALLIPKRALMAVRLPFSRFCHYYMLSRASPTTPCLFGRLWPWRWHRHPTTK